MNARRSESSAVLAGSLLLAHPAMRDPNFRHCVVLMSVHNAEGAMGVVLNRPMGKRLGEFSGDFARDMTYSIAWALFALALLVAGILKKIPAARYAAMGLLCVTLVKLFFHDLAQLGQLYRIGAFVGVAVIAKLASFADQKFFSATDKQKETDETHQE